ncbi:hypothetical protein Ahy_A09g044675 [Arachis hypogaea]|uniref:HAT C-terminal dimerisation domain-containing protein n=1 Tax=Arachis hypogaea TaxID=3818 RepID=A0A445BKI4_ARAHY|nr:hypothetical protein Ahy_A09g044675 [Arachis hypogaea]
MESDEPPHPYHEEPPSYHEPFLPSNEPSYPPQSSMDDILRGLLQGQAKMKRDVLEFVTALTEDEIHGIMGIAVVLDPKYKIVGVEFQFEKIYPDPIECSKQVERIHQFCNELVNEYNQKMSSDLSHVGTKEVDKSENVILFGDDDHMVYLKRRKMTRAKDIYAILMSTVVSASAFSSSRCVISPHHRKFKESIIESLMCLNLDLQTFNDDDVKMIKH